MNARLLPEILLVRDDDRQAALPLATEGVLCYVWKHRWGSMLIEVREGRVFVNGGLVESAQPDAQVAAQREPGTRTGLSAHQIEIAKDSHA